MHLNINYNFILYFIADILYSDFMSLLSLFIIILSRKRVVLTQLCKDALK